jgi:hypothetical protein
LRAIPLGAYVAVLVILAVAGVAALAMAARRIARPALESPLQRAAALSLGLVLAAYAVIGLSRAQIDWDAITYYLFTAIGFTLAGHVSGLQSNAITIGENIPMAFPPILPTMYSEALTLAGWLHGTADGAVRLIPFCYLCGVAAATARLARRFVPAVAPIVAALAFLLMPVTINYMVAQALSLDMLNAFGFTLLLVELFGEGHSPWRAARLGLVASLTIMSKVTGPVVVVFALAALAPNYLGTRVARTLAALVAAALIASTWFVNPAATDSPWFYFACLVFVVALIAASRRIGPGVWPSPREFLVAAIALVPAGLYLVGLMTTVGSPATFYLGAFVNAHSPNYAWANHLIARANVYDSQNVPGLPQLYGVDVFLWWGMPAASMVLAIVGGVLALRAKDAICALLIPFALFELSFMTLFQQGDFRRLLPIAPFVAIFVIYAAGRVPLMRRAPASSVLTLSALGFPSAWTAQQTIFAVPLDVLNGLAFDQWHAADVIAIRNTLLYVFLIALVALAAYLVLDSELGTLMRSIQYRRGIVGLVVALVAGSAALSAFFALFVVSDPRPAFVVVPMDAALLAGAFLLLRSRPETRPQLVGGAALFLPFALAILMFEPVVATAASGFQPWAERVEQTQYYGYLGALRQVERTQHDGSVLTFEGYGVPWFSNGRLRRVELTDAFDLGLLRDALARRDRESLSAALRRYGVRGAILPGPSGPLRGEYDRLVSSGVPGLDLLDDPRVALRLPGDAWSTYEILPRSDGAAAGWARVTLDTRKDGAGLDINSIRIIVDREHAGDARRVVVRGTVVGDDSVPTSGTEEVETTVDLRGKGDALVPLDDLLADAGPAFAANAPRVRLNVVSVDVEFTNGELAWGTSNFLVVRGSTGWQSVAGVPEFVSDPDLVPMLRVRLSDSKQSGGIQLYPGSPATFGADSILAPELTNDYPVIAIALAASRACPVGTRYDIVASGVLSPLAPSPFWRKTFRLHSTAAAGGDALVDFRPVESSLSGHDVLSIGSIAIGSSSSTCKAVALIRFRHLAIDRISDSDYVVDGLIDQPSVSFAPSPR